MKLYTAAPKNSSAVYQQLAVGKLTAPCLRSAECACANEGWLELARIAKFSWSSSSDPGIACRKMYYISYLSPEINFKISIEL